MFKSIVTGQLELLFGTARENPSFFVLEDKTADLDQLRVPSTSTEAAQCTPGALLIFDTDNIWNCWLPRAPRRKKDLQLALKEDFWS